MIEDSVVGPVARLLVVDDDEAVRESVAEILRPKGYHVCEASDADADHALNVLAGPTSRCCCWISGF
jgi:CheY-like chemotaxis protein